MPEPLARNSGNSSQPNRWLAAGWFSGFAVLAMTLLWLPLLGRFRFAPVFLYMLLPAGASTVAGYFWGGAIADPSTSYRQALLRGLGVTAGALVVFAALFSISLPLVEHGWVLDSAPGLFLFTLFFGLLMAGPISLTAGMLASATLHALARRISARR